MRKELCWYNDPLGSALRQAVTESIRTHGPIVDSPSSVNSVVKRLYGVFKALEKGVYDSQRKKAVRSVSGSSICSAADGFE